MILIVGISDDPTIQYFLSYLDEEGVDYFFLNQNEIKNNIDLEENSIYTKDDKINFDTISGVLNRAAGIDDSKNRFSRQYSSLEILTYILNHQCHNVANPMSAGLSNSSKPYQLSIISRNLHYMKCPNTTILANFTSPSFPKKQIFKSVSGERSIVQEFIDDKKINITCPVLFQDLIRGENLRVHVIKNKVFTLCIATDSLDTRYPNVRPTYYEVKLPDNIEKECINITKKLNMIFTGIDLIRTENGEYYLLEVNPAPGYCHFEKQMKTKSISKSLMLSLKEI